MHKIPFYLILFSFIMSCHNSKVTSSKPNDETEFQVLYNSEYGGTGDGNYIEIINDRQQFAFLWSEMTFQPVQSAPKFDPDNQMIVRKDFQSRRTGGNQMNIESVKIDQNKVKVFYNIQSSAIGTDAITNPVVIIRLNKVENPVIDFELVKQQ